MPRQELGSESGSAPKTPTLKQFATITNGKLPKISYVKIVFVPGKVPNYTLVTDHDFRVNVYKDSPLYHLLGEQLAAFIESGATLAIQPNQEDIGKFALLLDDDRPGDWTAHDWGYLCQLEKQPTATSKSTR